MGKQYSDKYGPRVSIGFDEKFWDPYHNGKELDEAAYNKIAKHTANLENFYANGDNSNYKSPFDLFAKAAGSDARAGDSHSADVGKVGKIFDHIYNWDGDAIEVYGPPKESAPKEGTKADVNPPAAEAESDAKVTADLNKSQAVQPQIASAEEMAGQYQSIFNDQQAREEPSTDEQQRFRAKAKERAQVFSNQSLK